METNNWQKQFDKLWADINDMDFPLGEGEAEKKLIVFIQSLLDQQGKYYCPTCDKNCRPETPIEGKDENPPEDYTNQSNLPSNSLSTYQERKY